MKNVLVIMFICLFLIITVLIVIIIGYPISKTSHSSLTNEPNKNGFNFCVKEKRKYTRLLAMNLEMKDVYLSSEYQYYLKNNRSGDIVIIKSIPINVNVISICYFPKREVWVGVASDEKGNDPIIDFKVIVISKNLYVNITTVKTGKDLSHPIYQECPGYMPFLLNEELETIKYLSQEEKIENFKF